MDLKDIITKNDLKEPYIYLAGFLEMEDIFKIERLFNGRQIEFKKYTTDIYQEQPELVALLGKDKATKVAKILSSSYVYFPKLKQNCADKIRSAILKELVS